MIRALLLLLLVACSSPASPGDAGAAGGGSAGGGSNGGGPAGGAGGSVGGGAGIGFTRRVLTTEFRAEGVALADLDGNGSRDVILGDTAWLAPAFTRRTLVDRAPLDPATTFSDSFAVFAHDVNQDRRIDVIAVGFPLSGAVWREQPADGGRFTEHPLTGTAGSESPLFVNGRLVYARGADLMALDPRDAGESRLGTATAPLPGHGLGYSDVTGDGLADYLTPLGVFVAPTFGFVPADLGPDCAQMYAFDLNGDGLNDVVSSSAHGKGVWWHEQRAAMTFVRHTIDDEFSQSHALAVADLDGDGRPELITGKRRWAHGPAGDVDPNAPAVLHWYSSRVLSDAGVEWTRHVVDTEADSGVGTQFEVADVTGDGLLDVVVANKVGVHVFEQTRP